MVKDARFTHFVLGVALALMLGYVLFIGRSIFIPVVTSILVVYVIVGVSRLADYIPLVGKRIPLQVRYLLAALVIGFLLIELSAIFIANLRTFVARAPELQEALLEALQQGAMLLGIDRTLSWEAIRDDAFGTINLQSIVLSSFVSIAGLLGSVLFVLLNVAFLLMEQRSFQHKLNALSRDPAETRRLLSVIGEINDRVGRYLAVKTLINIALGLVSWAIMAAMGLEFAVFWAIIIALLNYIPYVGSILGVVFPVTLAIVQFDQFGTVLLLLGLLVGAQMLMGNIVEPLVMGNSLNLSPYVILLSPALYPQICYGSCDSAYPSHRA